MNIKKHSFVAFPLFTFLLLLHLRVFFPVFLLISIHVYVGIGVQLWVISLGRKVQWKPLNICFSFDYLYLPRYVPIFNACLLRRFLDLLTRWTFNFYDYWLPSTYLQSKSRKMATKIHVAFALGRQHKL